MSRFGAMAVPHCRHQEPGEPRRRRTEVSREGSGHGGWIAEQRWGPHNDWAPNIAADPSSSWLYQMTTQYGGHRVCRPHRNTASRSDPRRTGPGRAEHRAAAGARRGPVPRCYLFAQIAYARGAYVKTVPSSS